MLKSGLLFGRFLKRVIDILISLVVLILSVPIFLISMVLIYIESGWPVFFCQRRPGLKGKIFTLIKFRTMRNQYDEKGELLPDGMRLTSIGGFLRRVSFDELPQFINVLLGQMSVVGPRPLLEEYLPLYNERQGKRHLVRPGITGWAQINGRNSITWEEKFELDVWYVEHWGPWLDLRILFITFFKVLKREGISQEGEATMRKFTGSGG